MRLRDRLLGLFGRRPVAAEGRGRHRGPATHVIVLDGTMSSLEPGHETNAGVTFKLLREVGRSANLTVHYEAGIQWRDWSTTVDVIAGRGIDQQIRRAYGTLASRYRPGDSIYLVGFSRGAYAVRSLAGIVDCIGLVRAPRATVRTIRQAYRHYRNGGRGPVAEAFRRQNCHPSVEIEAIAVWDTVKSLGLRFPGATHLAEVSHRFHNHALGPAIKRGYHALALDETREAYKPVMWHTLPGWPGEMEQVWFRGTHGDVGGQLGGYEAARPLANIPLVWMLDRLEGCGMSLPEGWRDRFPCDVTAPSVGTWRSWGKILISRKPRVVGRDPSERLHETVTQLGAAVRAPEAKSAGGKLSPAPAD
ncbi:DUF2235 domain-containing protein [Histidinibacterium aquaticum]|uniref:DUF2235 domain-containing protein n=1 Tax=Histidinibacterium aquaticum TaxID=2613962 RepID=A0A5J5GIV0_9RHOB|nr:DUF2235 domain-containing protein [Histidinibacterium aquaticum]KAA9008085.1 DUF2235 domain-containing protein [Histidinibacterium aquaticum]